MNEGKSIKTENESGLTVRKMLTLKIIVGVFYALATIFVLIFALDVLKNVNSDGSLNLGGAIGLAFLLVFGVISYLPSFALSLVGVIVSAIRYSKTLVSKKTFLFFIISLILELLSVVGVFLFVVLIK